MSTKPKSLAVFLVTTFLVGTGVASAGHGSAPERMRFTHSSEITNPFLPISSFHRCRLAGNDQGTSLSETRTLLNRTRAFRLGGARVEAAVIRDRVISDGKLIELTHDYFAQNDAGTVFYLGEHVNEYEPGQPVSHEGQWLLGRDTDHPGVLMPAHPQAGDSFKSERVPGITHEVDHVVAARGHAEVEGNAYRDVIKVRENARPPRETEFKQYARGTGVITEANGGVHLLGCV
jgi:hypothetical protein